MDKRRYVNLPWEEWYCLASRYYRENHHLLVPEKYETVDGFKLGRWIERQRHLYKIDSYHMNETKKKKLEKIQMVWSIEERYDWDFWIELCQQYRNQYKTIDMPIKCTYQGIHLGEWIYQQRKKKRQGLLSEEKIEELDKLNMHWESDKRKNWETWYVLVENYYRQNGNLNIRINFIDEQGNKLGKWISLQRAKYYHKKTPYLTYNQIKKLESLRIKW